MIAQKKVTIHGARSRVYEDIAHYVVCAYCGETGPQSLGSDQDAHDYAIAEGWHSRDAGIGETIFTVYTCPNCLGTA